MRSSPGTSCRDWIPARILHNQPACHYHRDDGGLAGYAEWNLQFFHEHFGDREIEVQMGRNAGTNYEVEKREVHPENEFSRFVEMIRAWNGTNDFYLTANNNSSNKKGAS